MHKGPKPAELTVSEHERNDLEELVRRHSTPQQLATRGRMILAAAQGQSNAEIARALGFSVDTVRSWRTRWMGLQGVPVAELEVRGTLAGVPRAGRPSQVTT